VGVPDPFSIEEHKARALRIPVRQQAESGIDTPVAKAATPVQATEEGDFWAAIVKRLVASELVAALVRELALHAQLVARDTDQWLLRVEREALNQPGARDRLQAALALIDHPVSIAVEIGRVTDSPAKRQAEWQEQRRLAVEKIIFADPFVQDMMTRFGAKIIPSGVKAV
jgi:DNA polymerase III subunit gamma/tau